ncbi:nucleoporin NUP188-like isoform X2 [Lineus longissimus]|uniref:nucleoporin NUP188-like isoform X2 n=1 Tax=Lineus longissimus TaxID=88925 RepID=UPI00315CC5AC
MFERSNKALWQYITGSSTLKPPDAMKSEISSNKEKLIKGLLLYRKQTQPVGEVLKEKKLDAGPRKKFVLILSNFLGLEEGIALDLFSSYLLNDFRGAEEGLKSALKDDRYVHALLLKIRDYYFSERLYLLRTIKHISGHWRDNEHPFKDQYAEFVEENSRQNVLIEQIRNQYEMCYTAAAPNFETHGSAMNERQACIWLVQNLREQCELLEIILLFYKDFQHQAKDLLSTFTQFKKQGFGKHQTNKHLLDESMELLVARIGYLQVLVVLEALDFESFYKCYESDTVKEHHIIKSAVYKELDKLFCSLGDHQVHAPLVLAWTVIRQIAHPEDEPMITRKLGNVSLQLNVFGYLLALLESGPFDGKSVVSTISSNVLYGLLSLVLSVFREDTLGDTGTLYAVVIKLLKRPDLSSDLWEKGLDVSVGMLVQSAVDSFPLNFNHLVRLCTSLATDSIDGAEKVFDLMSALPVYTEFLDQNRSSDFRLTADNELMLMRDRRLYHTIAADFIIPKETQGQLLSTDKIPIVQWQFRYSGWQILTGEVAQLLQQMALGSGSIKAQSLNHVHEITDLLHAVLTSFPELSDSLSMLTGLMYQLLQRFSVLSPPSLENTASCLDVIASLAKINPQATWKSLQHTGFLPFLTENFSDLFEAASGAGLNPGGYGAILARSEIPLGSYPLTLSYLQLVSNLVECLDAESKNVTTACVLYILREIFPVFQKWRFYNIGRREMIGQKCLDIFHKILNVRKPSKGVTTTSGPSLVDICIYCLMFTEAGRSLLDVISIGVDSVDLALSQQGSAQEGIGTELIQQIRLAFSVLNRLLLLRPANQPPSPVEHALTTQPANRLQKHVVATIAQYIYHRHDPRLPALSTRLLKRLAMVSPMSLMACLGNDAPAVRDIFLSRLQEYTEDIRLKVVILELLAVCVETQPGLIEMFLNIQLSDTISANKKTGEDTGKAKKELSLGRVSCLQIILNLLKEHQQGTFYCPPDLLCAATELLHALWYGRRETAMAVLRDKSDFWQSLCNPLMLDLPEPSQDVDLAMMSDIKTFSYIIRILAHELYGLTGNKVDSNLEKVLGAITKEKRLVHWSKYIRDTLQLEAERDEEPSEEQLAENSLVHLLCGWKSFITVLASFRGDVLSLSRNDKDLIMSHILDGVHAQLTQRIDNLRLKLASIGSEVYFILLKRWIGSVKSSSAVLEKVTDVLRVTCANSETLIPGVQVGLLGSLILLVQEAKSTIGTAVDTKQLLELLNVLCPLLHQRTHQLIPEQTLETSNMTMVNRRVKPQVLNICLLNEVLLTIDNPDVWLPVLQEHATLPLLLSSLQMWIKAKQGIHYVQSVIMFLQTLARIPKVAEAIMVNGFTQHLCLPVTHLYTQEFYQSDKADIGAKKTEVTSTMTEAPTWLGIYRQFLSLVSSMLSTLRFSFLQDALDFLGVHQDRMIQCLGAVRVTLICPQLQEAEATLHLLYELAHFIREWRLQLPQVMDAMMLSLNNLMQTSASMITHPRLLQHILERQYGKETSRSSGQDRLSMAPLSSRLQHQSSTEDVDHYSPQLISVVNRLMNILAQGMSIYRKLSPDLCEILLDQSMDISEYEPLLTLSFSSPSLDTDGPLSYGTILSSLNIALKFLTKIDPRGTSPAKSPSQTDWAPITKSLLMYILENAIVVLMCQAMRHLKDATLSPRDKQFLKRELGAELNSFLQSFHRYIRKGGPPSPAGSSLPTPQLNRSVSLTGFQATGEQRYFKMVADFVKQVLR